MYGRDEAKSLQGKIAVVTGAANGMGLAITKLLSCEGAKVIALDNDGRALQENCSSFLEDYCFFNVADEDCWEELGSYIRDRYEKLDILVNAAGIVSGEKIEDATSQIWDNVVGVNAKGCYLGMKMAIPLMKTAGSGSIVNISSIAGISGTGGGTAYHASKSAIKALTKRVATHYGRYRIRANTIYPGWVKTNMTKNARSEKVEEYQKRQPLPYFGEPEDIANAVLFLVTENSRFITGADLVIDGGFSIN